MKLLSQREGLLTACQLVSAAVAARTTQPTLSNVKATAEDDALTLVANDTEIGIRYELRGVTIARAGSAILPIASLIQILREHSDAEISLDATESNVGVQIGTSNYELPSYPVEAFPDLPAFDGSGRSHEVKAGDLKTMIHRTVFAADKKDSGARFALTGVLWEAEGNVARLVATDSKRLAMCEGPATLQGAEESTKASHLVPGKAMALLERNLTDDGELIRVVLRANEAMFQTDRAMIYTRLVEGRYPPYRDIVGQTRKGATQKLTIPVDAFLSKVRQAAIATDEDSKRVDMTFEAGKITMQARGSAKGSSRVEMPLGDYDGPPVKIAFDPQYLVEFLRAVAGEPTVTLEMADGTKPALFRAGDSYLYLVMPLTN